MAQRVKLNVPVLVVFKLSRDRNEVSEPFFTLDNLMNWFTGDGRFAAFQGDDMFEDLVEEFDLDITSFTVEKETFIETFIVVSNFGV